LGLVAAWSAGLVLGHSGWAAWPEAVTAGFALAGLAAVWLARRRPAVWAIGLFVAVAAAGLLRIGDERQRLPEWEMLPPREARLELRVERVFAAKDDETRAGGIGVVTGTDAHLADLSGQRIHFAVTWPKGAPPPARGATFAARGLFETVPFAPETADFKRFLANEGVNFSLRRARVEGTPGEAGAWTRFCVRTGARLEGILRAGLGDNRELADLYVAMLLGQKQEIGERQKDLFIQSGTMHLFAISGLHIVGIALAVNTLLVLLRMPARGRFLTGTLILWTYVEITGSAPSAVRAFWMVTCLHGARQLRAPSNSLAALSASALVVLVLQPHQLFSASFQMSYGIVAALLLYGVPLQEAWQERWRPWANLPKENWTRARHGAEALGRHMLSAVALGLAATLVSMPATLSFFSLMTPGAFFANLLLIPLSTPVLFAGVCSMIAGGAGLGAVAGLFNHAGALVLKLMAWLVERVVEVPGVSWPATYTQPWLSPFLLAGMPALLALGYAAGWPRRWGGYWVPYAMLGLVLVLGVRAVSVMSQ